MRAGISPGRRTGGRGRRWRSVGNRRLVGAGWRRKLALLGGVAAYALVSRARRTEPAIADGDTRTLTFSTTTPTRPALSPFAVNGHYDEAALDKLNWFMRDWRLNEQIKMDPHLFDIIWEVYRAIRARASRSTCSPAIARRRPTPCCAGARVRSPNIRSICRARRSTRISSTSGRADPRYRDADAGGRRRILPDRFDALGAHRLRIGALLAAHEPQRAGAAVSRTARRCSFPPTASRWRATSKPRR